MYSIVQYDSFQAMMTRLENNNVPMIYEMDRIFKLMRALFKIISKDEELLQLHQNLIPSNYQTEPNLLLVHDFYRCYKQYKSY